MQPLPIVVLCSGRGSNLQALIDAERARALPIQIRAVVSDQPQCRALERARSAGIATVAMQAQDFSHRADFDAALFAEIARLDPQLVVFAGYMRIVAAAVISGWRGRMINIHPSLLPKYPGLRTHQRAIDAGDAEHGASVHWVTPQLDGGPVIAQVRLPIHAEDDAASLAARLLPLEHRLLIASVDGIARGGIGLEGDRVVHAGRPLATALTLDENGALVPP